MSSGVQESRHTIELITDATGAFSELKDKGMWESSHMKLVALPKSENKPATVGILEVLPNGQSVYVESSIKLLKQAITELSRMHDLSTSWYCVTLQFRWLHGSHVLKASFTIDVEAASSNAAASIATSVVRTFYGNEITDVKCKKIKRSPK